MAEKAKLFDDHEAYEKVFLNPKPGAAKAVGREVKNFDGVIWDAHKIDIVIRGNLHKFSQSESLKSFLLSTHERVLVEASPVDKIWGVGLAYDDRDVQNPNLWKGENLLGFALMEVRDLLKSGSYINGCNYGRSNDANRTLFYWCCSLLGWRRHGRRRCKTWDEDFWSHRNSYA